MTFVRPSHLSRIREAASVRLGVTLLPFLALGLTISEQPSVGVLAPAAVDNPAAKAAKKIYSTFCSTCHGMTGKGDGAAAVALNPKPRSLSDGKWQASVSNDHIKKVIMEGGASVKLSPLMAPAKAMFESEPKGTLEAMVQLVRDLSNEKAPSATAKKAAKKIYSTFCSTCHGATGKGDGAAAVALNPKPRTLTDPKWQDSVSDDHVKKVIMEGGASVKLSPLMAPAKAMFESEPKGTLEAMVDLVRDLREVPKKKAPAKKKSK